jgi:acetylornithine deacetylase/succinyl-diaminopimelate desuccinylase-like protein
VSPLTLEDFEREALPALLDYGTIDALSPDFDEEWERRGRIEDAAQLIAEFARGRSLSNCDVAIHRLKGRTPVVTATIGATSPATGTVVLYGHLDKQPPLGDWSEGLAPFSPTRRGDRLYGRGLADDGYAAFSALLAIEEIERRGVGHARCVVLIESSEESGSPDLEAHLDALKDHLGDVQLLICLDSGALSYDRLWVTTSLRGNLVARVRVDVLDQGRHSGVASGVVPSSFRVMRLLLDRLEDPETGELRLDALHREVPEDHRRAAEAVTGEFGDVAGDEQPIVEGLRLMGDGPADRLLRRTWKPTLSVTGVEGIPPSAVAGNVLRPFTELVVSIRVPPGVDGDSATAAVRAALTTDPPVGAKVTVDFRAFAEGWVMPPAAPWLAEALDEASGDAFGRPAAYAGEGGSIPFLAVLGQRYPGVQIVATGVLVPDSNAHTIDEMLHLPTAVAVTNAVGTLLAAHARGAG